jgi:acetyltransferase-like isoleucine patch superfamily enzyme
VPVHINCSKSLSVKIREIASDLSWRIRYILYTRYYGMHIHRTARISASARLDKTNPRGVYIGKHTYVTFGAVILAHDMCTNKVRDTRVGDNVFVGANSMILAGVTVANDAIIGAGSIVTSDVPSNVIVAGNPARIIRRDVAVGPFGILRTPPPRT